MINFVFDEERRNSGHQHVQRNNFDSPLYYTEGEEQFGHGIMN